MMNAKRNKITKTKSKIIDFCKKIDKFHLTSQKSILDYFSPKPALSDLDVIFLSYKEPNVFNPREYHRFTIVSVDKTTDNEKIKLTLKLEGDKSIYFCELSGQWTYTKVQEGDIVNIKCEKYNLKTLYVDNSQGFIIVNPDKLITSTLLSSSIFCPRKAWLSQKFKGWTSSNRHVLIGTIIHEIFQAACVKRIQSLEDLQYEIISIVSNIDIMIECMVVGFTASSLLNEIQRYVPFIMQFLNAYVYNGSFNFANDQNSAIKVNKVHDIEENVWCPRLGIKGKIDATVEVEIHDRKSSRITSSIVPLELKTGKTSMSFEHQGQVILYSMMKEEIEGHPINDGLLLYLKDGPKINLIKSKRPLQQGLIQTRNELAFHLSKLEIGPPIKDTHRPCSNCDHLLDCLLMAYSFQNSELENSKFAKNVLFPEVVKHLKEIDLHFFKECITSLHLELEAGKKNKIDFWNESSEDRQSQNLALAKLVITCSNDNTVTLKRHRNYLKRLGPFTNCSFFNNERVALSLDETINFKNPVPSKVAFAVGFVQNITEDEVEVVLENKLRDLYFSCIIRLDLIQNSSVYTTNFDNILRLMVDDDISQKLRNIIIHRTSYSFNEKYLEEVMPIAKEFICSLNPIQQNAVLKALSCNSYLLMRGTCSARIEIIIVIIQILARLKKSILITSYTHDGVDNILCKLKTFNDIHFVRIGTSSKINPEIKKYSLINQISCFQNIDEIKEFCSNIDIVATTCFGINNSFFDMKRFDYCIIDDATEIPLLTSLGPLFYCEKFILVGKHKDLSFSDDLNKKQFYEKSIFACLDDANTIEFN